MKVGDPEPGHFPLASSRLTVTGISAVPPTRNLGGSLTSYADVSTRSGGAGNRPALHLDVADVLPRLVRVLPGTHPSQHLDLATWGSALPAVVAVEHLGTYPDLLSVVFTARQEPFGRVRGDQISEPSLADNHHRVSIPQLS